MSEATGVDLVRVLIADDEVDLRRVIRHHLHRHGGFTVVGEAGDGNEAISFATDLQPDIVLLDLRMPNLDGREALPQILKHSPRTMVVVLSMLPAATEEAPLLAGGAFAYLEKHEIGTDLIGELALMHRSFLRALDGDTVVAPAHLPRPTRP